MKKHAVLPQDETRARQLEKDLRDYLQRFHELLLELTDAVAAYIEAANEAKNKGGKQEEG